MKAALTFAREALQVLETTEDEASKERVQQWIAEWESHIEGQKRTEASNSR
jgi:hypothetical protein